MSETRKTKKAGALLNAEEVYLFSMQISMMLKAGILPADGVALLEAEAATDRERGLLAEMKSILELGTPFHAAMQATGCFPEHAVRMVRIGEDTGRLEQVLTALARYYQQEHELRENMRQAVVYPAWLAVVIGIVTFVLVTRVLPVFQQVLEQMGSGLSQWALNLMRLGAFSKVGAIVFTTLLVILAGYLFFSSRTEEGHERLRRFADHIFFRGALGVSVARERFASAVSLSLASGLNLNDALDRARLLVDEPNMMSKIDKCKSLVEEGVTFSSAVEQSGIFTGLEVGLISAGFRAGSSDEVMREISRRCHDQTEDIMSRLMSKIEPMLVIILVFVVGMLLLSVMIPLIAMMKSVGS